VNGAASVIGTTLATAIAIYGGFTTTFVVGAAGYAAAAGMGYAIARAYRYRATG
jgi:hypothetical protein